ncbi:MAG: hypothetical protein A2481_01015 [Candidatus Yonathbacteria bacterium RIFOXYC2_FULL_47_9]|nr:MAG: hypothetical protein A2481_01015 [Candidatus Yonathbacteria bacterium RIFOXYC2_FULL_47_9]
MKIFPIHRMHKVLAIVTVGALLAVTYLVNPNLFKSPNAEAGATQNLSGWVWSLGSGSSVSPDPAAGPYTANSNTGLGWISFNSASDGTTGPGEYGVNVNTATKATAGKGNFSGNAWVGDTNLINGDNTGWVSFDRGVAGDPPSDDVGSVLPGTPLAYVDWSNGEVHGWMRALSACKNNNWDGATCTSSGAGDAAGSWDGWIKLSDDTVPFWAGNGVKISDNKLSGYAWGSDIVGWVNFAPNIGGINVGPVIGVPPCVAADVPVGSWGACQQIGSCPVDDGSTSGIQVGVCPTGGTVTRLCTTPTALVCVEAPVVGPGCGNGICSEGETPLTCAKDCKLKIKQF